MTGESPLAELGAIDRVLLDEYQSGFPIRERPYEAISEGVTYDAEELFERLGEHVESGLVRRVGPVLDPSAIGASTLAALRVRDDDFDDVAAVVNGYTEVTHNYRRDHEWNMWFVLTASSPERRAAILREIEHRTGYKPLSLPKRRQYRLDLQFPIVDPNSGRKRTRHATDGRGSTTGATGSRPLMATERRVIDRIQDGFPLTPTPYRTIANELGLSVSTLLSTVRRLLDDGFIKRIGIVVNHHAAGYTSNCMVVWDVPDEEVDSAGKRASNHPSVTKCYHRPRHSERGWEYTLFTMIHERSQEAVDERIDALADALTYPFVRLETVARLKQTGTRYDDLLDE